MVLPKRAVELIFVQGKIQLCWIRWIEDLSMPQTVEALAVFYTTKGSSITACYLKASLLMDSAQIMSDIQTHHSQAIWGSIILASISFNLDLKVQFVKDYLLPKFALKCMQKDRYLVGCISSLILFNNILPQFASKKNYSRLIKIFNMFQNSTDKNQSQFFFFFLLNSILLEFYCLVTTTPCILIK